MSSLKKIAVIYHKNCLDGFGSAWVSRKKFGSRAEYFPAIHQSPPPKGLKGKIVYMLDFCYPEDVMLSVKKAAKSVVVIDHHVSQKEAVKISDDFIYRENKSGSTLSWKYFFPKKKVPKLLSYIEDKDIWKFRLKGTNELLAAVETEGFDFKKWDKLAAGFETANGRKKYFKRGSSIMAFSEKAMESIIGNAEWVIFEKRKCLAVNSPLFISEIGHILANKAEGIGIIWCKKGGKIKVSLRSNGKVDVSKIALRRGGGGHAAASSFSFEAKKMGFPWKSTQS